MTIQLNNIFSLKGKTIIITGATGLLGQQHAIAIAAYGGNPVLLDLDVKSVEMLAEKLSKQYSVNATGFAVDITDELQIKANVNLLIKYYLMKFNSSLLKSNSNLF